MPVPDPVLTAYGGRCPYSRNLEVRTVVYWITTVAAPSWPSSVLRGRAGRRCGRRSPVMATGEHGHAPDHQRDGG